MKRFYAIILVLALLLSLGACGAPPAAKPEEEDAPQLTSVLPGASSQKTPAPAPTEAPKETSKPEPDEKAEIAETVAKVKKMKGQPVADLIELLGEPISKDYSSSCLIEGGQDGQLVYDGFIVYTLVQKDGTETIYDCE